MVWPQSLSLSLWRVWELVFCMERGYILITNGTSIVYTGASICTELLMIPAYKFIVVGSPLLWSSLTISLLLLAITRLLCSPWPVSIWARSRVVIYFIVVGSPLLLCSPWPVSIWARSRVVIYVPSSHLRFLLIRVEHHLPSIPEVTLTKMKFLP